MGKSTAVTTTQVNKFQFRYINPSAVHGAVNVPQEVRDSARTADVIHSIECLAHSAMEFYRGLFPITFLYMPIQDLVNLPWYVDYFTERQGRDGRITISSHGPTAKEVCSYTYALALGGTEVERFAYVSAGSVKSRVQAMAVEAVMFLDECIDLVVQRKRLQAMQYLLAANMNLFDMTAEVSKMDPSLWDLSVDHSVL